MDKVRFDPQVSLGSLITTMTLVAGIALGWQSLAASVAVNQQDIARVAAATANNAQRLDSLNKEELDRRVQLTKMLAELQTDLRYLRAAVDDIKRGQ